eukprot:711127-Prymnesium_polylepis.1
MVGSHDASSSDAPASTSKLVVGKRIGLAHNGPRVAGAAPPEWLLNQSGPAGEHLLSSLPPAP